MTLRRRLITVLVIMLCAGGVYAAGHLGLTIRQNEETEAEEDSLVVEDFHGGGGRRWWRRSLLKCKLRKKKHLTSIF